MKKKINPKQLQVSNNSDKYSSIEEEEKKEELVQELSPEEKEKQRQENIQRVMQFCRQNHKLTSQMGEGGHPTDERARARGEQLITTDV